MHIHHSSFLLLASLDCTHFTIINHHSIHYVILTHIRKEMQKSVRRWIPISILLFLGRYSWAFGGISHKIQSRSTSHPRPFRLRIYGASDNELQQILQVAMDASQKAGEIILQYANGADVVETKSNSRDLLTLVDPLCEKVCVTMPVVVHQLPCLCFFMVPNHSFPLLVGLKNVLQQTFIFSIVIVHDSCFGHP